MKVSIIICTSNRASDLQETLAVMDKVLVPEGIQCELVVVDNASTDNTRVVIESTKLSRMPVRYIYEAKRGKGNAYNAGMAQATGDIFLWTDDDVRPPHHWIEGMCRPILSGEADAVAGGVKMAPHLERPWMTMMHRSWLAETARLDAESPDDMVGANMAFSREVLSKVPAFDTELGPGALGFADDTLFSYQLKLAGYKIASALDVVVEHHFDESRLLRSSFLDSARKFGRTQIYLYYHWQHNIIPLPHLRMNKRILQLALQVIAHPKASRVVEGISPGEAELQREFHFYKQYLVERKRPHNYEKLGLVKLPAQ